MPAATASLVPVKYCSTWPLTKVIQLRESRMLELRFSSTNVFNHPIYSSIDTVLNSPTYGRVISVSAMRAALMTARFRF